MPPLNEALNQAGGALAGDLLPANTALPKVQANVACACCRPWPMRWLP
jgi:hypothetical protein